MTCALLGLTLVLFVIGVDQLIRATSGVPERARRPIAGARASPRPGDRGRRGTEPADLPAEGRAGDSSGHDPGGLDRAG